MKRLIFFRIKLYRALCVLLRHDYLNVHQVGGAGISPGANINYLTGHAIFEATHGTAPQYANLDKVNPASLILSGLPRPDASQEIERRTYVLGGVPASCAYVNT